MALKTPYLAAENSAMARRQRALHRFLALSPLALLIAVGLVAHLPKPPYPHPAGNPDYDRKVLAYRDDVVAAQSAVAQGEEATTEEIRRVAQRWIDDFASGKLAPVPSAVYEDHFRDGVRGEIVRVALDLGGILSLRGNQTIEAGHPVEGAGMEVTAGELAHCLRGFDIQAHLQSLLLVRRAMGVLGTAWPRLPADTKDALRPRLRRLVVDPSEIDALEALDASLLKDYLARQKIDVRETRGGFVTDEEKAAALRGVATSNERVNALLGPKG